MCLNNVLNVKALKGAINQEEAQVWAFSMIVKLRRSLVEIPTGTSDATTR